MKKVSNNYWLIYDYVDTTKRINYICYDTDSKEYFVKGDKDIRKVKIIISW